MRLDTILVLASLAVPGAARPAPTAAAGAPATVERSDKGVRFELPAGHQIKETVEKEPGEEEDTVFVATKGAVELRVEVEKGEAPCAAKDLAAPPRRSTTAAGLATCEVELPGPPSADPKVGARRATSLSLQFPGRYLSVVVFAPDQATATKLARQVAASAAEAK
jgi:hypothetical protein